jgi:hypothetical protein
VGIREQLNENPSIVTGGTIGIIVIALIFIVYEIHGSSSPHLSMPSSRYYSDDDGASYFSDAFDKVPPFDHNGKTAVAAYVFRCKSGRAFVGYLQRYSPKALKALAQVKGGVDSAGLYQTIGEETEYSAPLAGEKGWVKSISPQAQKIMAVQCPGGGNDVPESIQP